MIYPCSPKARKKLQQKDKYLFNPYADPIPFELDHFNAKYPWKELDIGKCFIVSQENIKYESIKALASRKGRLLDRKFTVVTHKEDNLFEVARIL